MLGACAELWRDELLFGEAEDLLDQLRASKALALLVEFALLNAIGITACQHHAYVRNDELSR